MLRREEGHVLRTELKFVVKIQRKKGRQNSIWKGQVEKEGIKVGVSREDALCQSKQIFGINKWPQS